MSSQLSVEARIDAVAGAVDAIVRTMGASDGLVQVALTEALTNAVIYGALRVPSGGANRDTSSFLEQVREAELRLARPPAVQVQTVRAGDRCTVSIRDPGSGFDWRAQLAALDRGLDPLAEGGRGITVMRAVAAKLEWNEAGNEVRLEFELERSARADRVVADGKQ